MRVNNIVCSLFVILPYGRKLYTASKHLSVPFGDLFCGFTVSK